MRTVAGRLAAHDPDNAQWSISLAYATRRAQSIEAAKPILLEAVERHPKGPILHYNLACSECQLGEFGCSQGAARPCVQAGAEVPVDGTGR